MNAPSPRPAPNRPIAFSRRGACPALSAPMQTGDGLLVRLNPVAGGLSPKTLIGLSHSSARHGNGIMEVTARGSLQIRGLTSDSARLLAGEVDALGIAVRTGLPVETGPLAGLDPAEIADPRPLAERIRQRIDAAGLSARLGPKVSVVIDGGGDFGLDTVAADVRLVAQGAGLWHLALAGDANNAISLGVLSETDAADVAIEILARIAAIGLEARARDLVKECSSVELRSTLPPSVLPSFCRGADISPTRVEISQSQTSTCVISPLVGEMSGRTEGGAKKLNDRRPVPGSPMPLSNSCYAVAIALPFGSVLADTLVTLCGTAAALGVDDIRTAPGRRLIALCPSPEAAAALRREAATLELITDSADPRAHIAACPGKPACASGNLAARDIAQSAAAIFGDLVGPDFVIHISGCAKGCARPAKAAITLVGDEKGAGLVVDGTAKDFVLAYMPVGMASEGLERMAKMLRDARRPNETAAATITRTGAEKLLQAFGNARA